MTDEKIKDLVPGKKYWCWIFETDYDLGGRYTSYLIKKIKLEDVLTNFKGNKTLVWEKRNILKVFQSKEDGEIYKKQYEKAKEVLKKFENFLTHKHMKKEIPDFPFTDLLGLKPKKDLSEKQKVGKKLLDIIKRLDKSR